MTHSLEPEATHAPRSITLLSVFTRHPTLANLLLILTLAFGITATTKLRAQFFPDVVFESLSTSIRWPGAGAQDVDGAITAIVEPALLAVRGVTSSSSMSREGISGINLEFEPGTDMAQAKEDVRSVIDTLATLPDDIEEPQTNEALWFDRVTDVVIHGPVERQQLMAYADELTARLFDAQITQVSIRGVGAPGVSVRAAQIDLIKEGLNLREIAAAIEAEVRTTPLGDVASGTARVRSGEMRQTPQEISRIPLRVRRDGSILTIGDVATVEASVTGETRTYFVGPNPAVVLQINRDAKGDAIAIQEETEKIAAAMQGTLPDGVRIELTQTRADAITGRLNTLLSNGAWGLLFVIGLLFLFLTPKTAFWVAAGIPVAMSAALGLMFLMGLSLNMISLFALIICLGIVVDDAIVVGEHTDYRARHMNELPVVAAERAASGMFMLVFAATLTTCIAFLGLTVIGGRFGGMILDIPLTVIAVLGASLFECFLILPHHMAHALRPHARRHWSELPSHYVNTVFHAFNRKVFCPLVRFALLLRYPMIGLLLWLIASQAALFLRGDVVWRFFNAPERGSISGNFAMQDSATEADTRAMMRALQEAASRVGAAYEDEFGRNPILFALGETGGNTGRGLSGMEGKDDALLGSISLDLIDADLRPYSSFDVLRKLEEAVERHAQLEVLSFRGSFSGPGGAAIDVRLSGADLASLKAAAEEIKARLRSYPEISGLEDSLAYDKPEIKLSLTPEGRALGLDVVEVERELAARLEGITAARFAASGRSAEITVGLMEEELRADFLQQTQLRTPSGSYVRLSDVMSFEERVGFSTIVRENAVPTVSVTGDLSEDEPKIAADILQRLREEILPDVAQIHGVAFELSGLAEQERAFLNDALIGFALCIMGIFATLAWVFGSWLRPLVVIMTIPFGFIGVIYGHYHWGVPLSMFSVVGVLGMAGIVINDSIILISTIERFRALQKPLREAILCATEERLRAVMLTTLTTVLGLAPLLFEQSRDAQFLKPTVITLVYGLGFGMVLVLIFVPIFMVIGQDLAHSLKSLRRITRRYKAAWLMAGLMALAFALTLAPALLGAFGISAPDPLFRSLFKEGLPLYRALLFMGALALLSLMVLAIGLFKTRRRGSKSLR